jgi:hypothetical protein
MHLRVVRAGDAVGALDPRPYGLDLPVQRWHRHPLHRVLLLLRQSTFFASCGCAWVNGRGSMAATGHCQCAGALCLSADHGVRLSTTASQASTLSFGGLGLVDAFTKRVADVVSWTHCESVVLDARGCLAPLCGLDRRILAFVPPDLAMFVGVYAARVSCPVRREVLHLRTTRRTFALFLQHRQLLLVFSSSPIVHCLQLLHGLATFLHLLLRRRPPLRPGLHMAANFNYLPLSHSSPSVC